MSKNKFERLREMIVDLRGLAYETGYVAGKSEAGVEIGKEYQMDRIAQRNAVHRMILETIDDLENKL